MIKALAFLVLFVTALSPVSVYASENDAEEQYAPIPELEYHAPKHTSEGSVFDEVKLHLGASFLNSYQDVPVGNGSRVRGGVRGADFNFGVDLFSTHWILQGDLFTLPETTLDQTKVSSNGFELRVVYDTSIFEGINVHGGLGISNRNYGIKTGNIDNSMSSGATVLVTGIDYWPVDFLSTGLEFSDHIPLANGDDPSSLDLAVKINGHF